MAHNVALASKNGPQGLQKSTWRPFLEVTPKQGRNDLFGRTFVGKSCTKKLYGQVWGNSGKPFAPPKFCLLLHPWWKGTSTPVAHFLKWQRGKCPILRRPCANYSTRTLFTLCCRLQCVTVININYQRYPKTRAVHNSKNMWQRVKTGVEHTQCYVSAVHNYKNTRLRKYLVE